MSTSSEHPGFEEVPDPTMPAATALGIRRMRRKPKPATWPAVTEDEVRRFKAAVVKLETWRAEHSPSPAGEAAPATKTAQPAASERQGAFLLVRSQTTVLGAARGPGVYYIE